MGEREQMILVGDSRFQKATLYVHENETNQLEYMNLDNTDVVIISDSDNVLIEVVSNSQGS